MEALPETINRYFEATNAHDVDRVIECFAVDAVVEDLGEDLELKGGAAIRKWIERITGEYKLAVTPLESAYRGEAIEIIAEVSGTFPGSPLKFRYIFKVRDDSIMFLSTNLI